MKTNTEQNSAESALKELHIYVKLLFLYNSYQFENKTLYREFEDEISPDESKNDSISFKNIPFDNLNIDRLHREFLDRLSETVSPTKGSRHIVVNHIFYWPDKIKVFVTINLKFTEGNILSKFLNNLYTTLKDIATVSSSI